MSRNETHDAPGARVFVAGKQLLVRQTALLKHHGKRLADACHDALRLDSLWFNKILPPSRDGRHIPLNPHGHRGTLQDERRGHAYISNSIRSSRYTVWDFLPKQFLFQATRLSNFYFICIGVPQTIPGLSTTGNYTTILPLLFFMLLTVIKEGYDDFRRHKMDTLENNRLATVLLSRTAEEDARVSAASLLNLFMAQCKVLIPNSRFTPKRVKHNALVEEEALDLDDQLHWSHEKWSSIVVGDVIRIRRDEAVPADLALIAASGEDSIAYIDTMALDGETNLKSRQVPDVFGENCGSISGIKTCHAQFVSEDPNRNLYSYNGRVTLKDATVPLTLNNLILRGSVLRNTRFIVGVVVNTGEDCKIRQNANHHPAAKKPRLERYSNQVVLTLIAYVVILSVGVSGGYLLWHKETEVNLWYISEAYVPFKEIIVGFLIMFNNVIPLALYVSLEIVKIGQMIMIHGDLQMYDEVSNTPMVCNTNTILENLGQVTHILSDKTGTLTENVMYFRKFSIAGLVWSHPRRSERVPSQSTDKENVTVACHEVPKQSQPALDIPKISLPSRPSMESTMSRATHNPEETTEDLLRHIKSYPGSAFSVKAREFILAMALCHMALPGQTSDGSVEIQASSPDEVALVQAAHELGYRLLSRSTQSITIAELRADRSEENHTFVILDVIEFSSHRKRMSIVVKRPDGRIWLLCKGADSVITPRLQQAGLAVRKSLDVRKSLQIERDRRRSRSPDTRRSASNRPSLTVRQRSSMDVRPGALSRKRSSMDIRPVSINVVVHGPKENFIHSTPHKPLLSAHQLDQRCQDDGDVFVQCFRHINQFATDGLRTLMFAHKYVSRAEYDDWRKDYHAAATALVDREAQIDAVGELIETDLVLLGATAIEDKLQPGVPETIEKLRRANIKLWMLTGDKRETAINIAHAARICTPDSDTFILDETKGDLASQLRDTPYQVQTASHHTVVVVDGHTLTAIEQQSELRDKFYALIQQVDSVICCRASPSQKANIVKAIRTYTPRAVTMAIGDGANDIAMIQASHVGIGISGKEGLQAARVADYSIAQFRFLQRLILVHGRWNYMRTAKFILMTFWKEQFFYMMQASYQQYNGYTGTSLYENWSLTVLNTLFTSLCVIIPGIFEQDLQAETLLAVPELYAYGQRNCGLNMSTYLFQFILATIQGLIVWFISIAGYGYWNTMGDNGLFALGDLSFSLGIVWTNVSLLIFDTHYKTYVVGISFFITVGGWWAWNAFMAGIYSSNITPYDVKKGFFSTFGNDPNWWLTFIVALAVLSTLEALHRFVARHVRFDFSWPFVHSRRRSDALNTTTTTNHASISGEFEENETDDDDDDAINVGMWQEMEKKGLITTRMSEMAVQLDGYSMEMLTPSDQARREPSWT